MSQYGQYGHKAGDVELQPPPYAGPAVPPQPQFGGGGYAPAPPSFPQQQQQSNNNVVVVNQPSMHPEAHTIAIVPRSNDFLILTIVMMVLCGLHCNWPAFVCLLPALCFGIAASGRNDNGDYVGARGFGRVALGCNILVFVYYALLILTIIALIVVQFTVGLALFNGIKDKINSEDISINTDPCYYNCY